MLKRLASENRRKPQTKDVWKLTVERRGSVCLRITENEFLAGVVGFFFAA